MTIGLPLAMLKQPEGLHTVALNFSGVRWSIYVDNELLDNDFPFGYPRWAGKHNWKLDPEHLAKATLYLPGLKFEALPIALPSLLQVFNIGYRPVTIAGWETS